MKDYDVLILNSAVNRVRAIAALQTYTDVVIVPDHDTGGRETTAYFEHHVALRGKRISIFEYPEACKDVNDYVLLQAGEAGGSLRTEK
jgi:DNA primase